MFEKVQKSYLSRAFGLLSIAQGINAVASFAVMTIFTRFLPPEEYGRVSLIWLFIMILSIIVDTRLNSAYCIRHYKVDKNENARNIYTILGFNALLAGLIYLILASFPGFFAGLLRVDLSHREIQLICLISASMVIGKFLNSHLLVSRKAFHYFCVSLMFNAVLLSFSCFLLFAMKMGYRAYLYGHLAAYAALSITCLIYLLREYPIKSAESFSLKSFLALVKLSLPLVPDAFLLMILSGAGRYLLNIFSGLSLVAIYSVAYMFASIFNTLVLAPFGQAITPVLYEKFARSENDYRSYLSEIFKYYWVVLMTLVLGCYSFFKEAFPFLVGEQYVAAYDIIAIIMMGLIISGGASVLSCTIILREKTHLAFLITMISAAVNILANIFLIPEMGLEGAAWASFISYLTQALMVTLYTQRMIPINLNLLFLIKFGITVILVSVCYNYLGSSDLSVTLRIALKMLTFLIYLLFVYRYVITKRSSDKPAWSLR